MRRAIVLSLTLAALLLPASTQAAATETISAPAFALDVNYCGDGTLTLDSSLIVQGGSANFSSGSCVLVLEDRVTLQFIDVDLSGSSVFDAFGRERTSIEFLSGSSLTMDGYIYVYPTGSKSAAVVSESVLTSNSSYVSIEAGTSIGAKGGKVTVEEGSTIESHGAGTGNYIQLFARDKGKIAVSDSIIDADGDDLNITTGAKAKVSLVDNDLSYDPVNFSLGAGTKCKSVGNTPPTPCP